MMLTFFLVGSCDYFGFHFPMLMSDQDRTALDNINKNINQISDENKEIYQFGDN